MGHPYYMETRTIDNSVIRWCVYPKKGGIGKRNTLEEDFIPLPSFPDKYMGRLTSVGNRL